MIISGKAKGDIQNNYLVKRNSFFFFLNCPFVQAELGEMDTWQGDANAWEDESEAAWEAEEVLR